MKIVLFDIDGTIWYHSHFINKYHHPRTHLTQISWLPEFFAINLQQTKDVLHALLDQNVEFGFITAAAYEKNLIIKNIEKLFDLEGKLTDCIYINGKDFGTPETSKGKKIHLAQENGLIAQSKTIYLVDDNELQCNSATEYGYQAILALGYPAHNNIRPNNQYLKNIIEAFELNINTENMPSLSSPLLNSYNNYQEEQTNDCILCLKCLVSVFCSTRYSVDI